MRWAVRRGNMEGRRIVVGLDKVLFTGGNIDQGGKHGLWELSIWSVHESNMKLIEKA